MEYSSPFKKYSAPSFTGANGFKLTPETAFLIDYIRVMNDNDSQAQIALWLERVQFAARVSNWNVATLAAIAVTRIAPKYENVIKNTPLTKPGSNNALVPVSAEEFLEYLSSKLLNLPATNYTSSTTRTNSQNKPWTRQERQKIQHDKHRSEYTLEVGDLVYKKIPVLEKGRPKKFQNRFEGPFVVSKVYSEQLIEVSHPEVPALLFNTNVE